MNHFIRLVKPNDLKCGLLECLSLISTLGDPIPSYSSYMEQLEKMKQGWAHIYVIEDIETKRIIGTGTLVVIPKLTHTLGNVGQIEDVGIHPDYQGQGLGKELIYHLCKEAKEWKCYKTVLNCSTLVAEFYKKQDFEVIALQMRKIEKME